jgi:hypothetical protein
MLPITERLPNTETERQVMIANGIAEAASCDVRANILRDHIADLRHFAQKLRRAGQRRASLHIEQAISALMENAIEDDEKASDYRNSVRILSEM